MAPHSYLAMPGVDRYTYWQMPIYMISLGAWFHLTPNSIESLRIFSVLWGCLYIACWFVFVRTIARDEKLALFMTSVIALDYSLVAAASDGRMEMMCAALGQAGLAAYVSLRNSYLNWALPVASLFGAAALFCHPMGALVNVFLLIVTLPDWRHLTFKVFALVAVPYLLGLTLCAEYILQAPGIFLEQAHASSYRVSTLPGVLQNLVNDVYTRYLAYYFSRLSGVSQVKLFGLLFGVVGVIALVSSRPLRSSPLRKILLRLVPAAYLGIAYIDNMKFHYYLIYATPIFSACGAVWAYKQFQRRGAGCIIASILLFGFVTPTAAGFARNIHKDEFSQVYRPTVATIRKFLTKDEIVIGPSELAFSLGFGPPLFDDCSMGYLSGIRLPKIYVMHNACGPSPRTQSGWDWSRRMLATRYNLVLANPAYSVYVRADPE